jgi:hypothetical protein
MKRISPLLTILMALTLLSCTPPAPEEITAQPPVVAPLPETQPVGQNGYAFAQLTAAQQSIYDKIFRSLQALEPSVVVTASEAESLGELRIFDIFYYVTCDHPELFWVEIRLNYDIASNGSTTVLFVYNMSAAERTEAQPKVAAWADLCLADLSAAAADFDKILHVYNYLISKTNYDLEAPRSQDILSVAVYGESVCMGYARATQYLLLTLGIPATTVEGYAEGEPHAWNLVLAAGDYYYLDTTWGEPELPASGSSGLISYYYFLATAADISATHTPAVTFSLPACDATGLNYYTYRERLFTHYDRDSVIRSLREDNDAGLPLSIRFTEESEFDKAVADLFFDNGLAALMPAQSFPYTYYLKEDLGIITVALPPTASRLDDVLGTG